MKIPKPKFVKTFGKRLYENDPDNINGIKIKQKNGKYKRINLEPNGGL